MNMVSSNSRVLVWISSFLSAAAVALCVVCQTTNNWVSRGIISYGLYRFCTSASTCTDMGKNYSGIISDMCATEHFDKLSVRFSLKL